MTRKLALALGASLLLLGACASEPSTPPPPVERPAPSRPDPAPPADQCGAAQAQRLVGRNRSEIPVPVNPGLQRVACTTCPVTMDFHPRRLNFFYDAETGIIKEVRCG
ncbi:MAG: hypothetical protein ACI9LT_002843 [Pseudoalteromonas distincta]|jgi:hypothetical protein